MGGFGFDFRGKKAIVLGIANEDSIAYAIAKKLNDAGCRVAIGFQERNKGAVKPLLKKFSSSLSGMYEATDDVAGDAFFRMIQKKWGSVDFLVHSIAFAKKEHLRGRSIDIDRKGFLVCHDVSVFSFVDVLKKAEPLMKNGGSCITLSFLGAEKAVPNYNVMGIAKAALESAVRYAANDLGKKNIRINAISAGPIPTSASSAIKGFDELYFDYVHKSPLKRATTKEDVAHAALFFLSDLSSGITGEVLHVDCGYHIMGI
jgi:enoyl-[acyl-carrier protein] reductase I